MVLNDIKGHQDVGFAIYGSEVRVAVWRNRLSISYFTIESATLLSKGKK